MDWTFRTYRRRTTNPKQKIGWKLVGMNGRTVAASSEGFNSTRNARKNAILTYDGLGKTLWQG
jgi:hypothetical protein